MTADANGVATLAVKSAKTASTNAYVVNAESNGHGGGQITATYTDAGRDVRSRQVATWVRPWAVRRR